MKGGSLTRFKPESQDGGGFVQELLNVSVRGSLKGLKSGRGIRDRFRRAKEGATWSANQPVKRKAYEVLERTSSESSTTSSATNESHLLEKVETRQI